MDDIFETFGQAIEDVVNNPILQISLRAIVVYAAVVWIAVAYWAFRDMRARTANLLLPYFAAGLIIAFTPIFFPFAVLVYRILRPTETIAEVYDRQLAAEAMEAEIKSSFCPECAGRVESEWIACPACGRRLNHRCADCGNIVGLDWALCAWCGHDLAPGTGSPRLVPPTSPAVDMAQAALQRAAEDSARTLGPGRGLVGPGNLRAVGNTGPRPGPSKRIGAE
jgi:hypothetical protein